MHEIRKNTQCRNGNNIIIHFIYKNQINNISQLTIWTNLITTTNNNIFD